MKILITSEWYKPVVNGVVRSILNLEKELINMGHDVRVLTMSPMFRSYKSGNVYYLASVNFGKFYPDARQAGIAGIPLIREIIAWSPDVVHSQTEFSSFLYAKFIVGRTKAAHVHTYHTVYEDYTHYFSPSKRLGKMEIAFFTKRTLSKVGEIIVPTEKTKSLLLKYGLNNPINVIPTGLELKKFRDKRNYSQIKELRKKIGIKKDSYVALYLGRLAKEKNFEELFSLIKNREKVLLLIVGDGPYRDSLEKLSKKLNMQNRVIFTGMVSPNSVLSYYQMADCFISSSMSETQGLTYIEALASGLPVIARKDPCLEGVVEDGVNGFLYENEKDFYEKLDILMSDSTLADKMSKEAKRIAKMKFSSEKFAKSVFSVYEDAIIAKKKKLNKRKKK